jgi:hypothetical protein
MREIQQKIATFLPFFDDSEVLKCERARRKRDGCIKCIHEQLSTFCAGYCSRLVYHTIEAYGVICEMKNAVLDCNLFLVYRQSS